MTMRKAAAPPGTPAASASGTNQPVEIYSDQFRFDRAANLITYSGHVRGEDTDMELRCAVMVRRRCRRCPRPNSSRRSMP